MSRRQSRRKEAARKEEKENAKAEMRKEKKKFKSKLNRIYPGTNGLLSIINRSRGLGLEKFVSYQAGLFSKKCFKS